VSIRLRLALWYTAVTALVLVLASSAAYVLHTRDQYEDVDRSLVTTADHFEEEVASSTPTRPPAGMALSGDPNILVRLYDANGVPFGATGESPEAPALTPAEVLAEDAGPAYDRFLRWLPGGATFGTGAFAVARDPTTGDRLRLYALPVGPNGQDGHVLTWSSLRRVDESVRFLRFVMLGVVLGGIVVAAGSSLAVAGPALRPIAAMTQTARAIAASRGFSRRLEEPARKDELGRLARTFNEMLASLEEAYRSQQRFVADAAHELRAPLTAIQGNVELLARMPDMPADERAEALAYLDGEARRLSRIVAELLTLARADAGQTLERRPVELDRVLLDALAEMRPLAEDRRLELTSFEPVMVNGDADRLKQLLLNLLDNSLKYTPPDGRISVELARSPSEAVLTIRDTGVGISREDLPQIFERFYRADPARSRDPAGTGLGLAIVRWIVDQHEGEISVDSRVGQGTTVTVRLSLLLPSDSGAAQQDGLKPPTTP
jgi:signal transduction histidine kinase